MNRKNPFGLRKKIVLGIAILSLVTYGTSFVFLTFLQPFFLNFMSEWMFQAGVLILGVLWSSLFGWVAARFLTQPLVQLEQTAEIVSTGDLRVKVNIPKGKDELRSLAIAFDNMLNNLKGMVRDIEDHFRQTGDHVQELTLASGVAATQAEQIGMTMEEIARGAETQSEAMSQMLASLEQLHRTVADVEDYAGKTGEMSRQMVVTIQNSAAVVESLIDGMGQLAKESERSIESVRRLENKALEIGDISRLVGSLAEQTNLLALNASIEAARAGEHGRGFAVVAQEVRKLADESKKAVQGINDLIAQMQLEVGQVVKLIHGQVRLAAEESKKGEETSAVLQQIILSVNEVMGAVERMVQLISDQGNNMQNAVEEARSVARIAGETSEGAQAAASAAQEQTAAMQEIASTGQVLREHAEALQEHIRRFTL